MSDHPAIEWLNTCPNIGANGERHIRSMAAQIARLEAECTNLATHGRVYKRQYEQACQDHATAMAEIERLLEVVQQIARQNLAGEISDDEREFADFYGAYDYIVTYTRAALAQSSPDKPSRVGDGIAAPTLFGFRVVESYDVPDDEIWMRAQTRVKIVRLLDLDKPDPLSQALNEGDGTYRP